MARESSAMLPSHTDSALVPEIETLSMSDVAGRLDAQQGVIPPHRSHDPVNNQKRTDPFQFGSRYLTEEDNVYEFNAWDHVETDDAYKAYAEEQIEKQRQAPVSDFDRSKLFSSWHAALSPICSFPIL